MGCPGGTRSVFTLAFRAKRELHCIFLGKKAFIITSKHGTTIFFSHCNLFQGKRKEKLAQKARVHILSDPIILLKSNKFNMAAVSVIECRGTKYRTYNANQAQEERDYRRFEKMHPTRNGFASKAIRRQCIPGSLQSKFTLCSSMQR